MADSNEVSTTVDGVRAIEIRYRPIFQTGIGSTAFYQSRLRLNAPEMGVLTPERFMPVLEHSDRCVPVFLLALLQVIKAGEKFIERELDFDWISVVMPLKILLKRDCVSILMDFMKKIDASPDKLCFEIPSLIIDENGGEEPMHGLRKAGFHTMLAGVDAQRFPMNKIAQLEPEYVIMNRNVTRMIGTGERAETCISSMISFIDSLGASTVASGVASTELSDRLYDLGCSYFTADEGFKGKEGSFKLERYIRAKGN